MRFGANNLIMSHDAANHVGWKQVHYLFTKNSNSKLIFVSLLAQIK